MAAISRGKQHLVYNENIHNRVKNLHKVGHQASLNFKSRVGYFFKYIGSFFSSSKDVNKFNYFNIFYNGRVSIIDVGEKQLNHSVKSVEENTEVCLLTGSSSIKEVEESIEYPIDGTIKQAQGKLKNLREKQQFGELVSNVSQHEESKITRGMLKRYSSGNEEFLELLIDHDIIIPDSENEDLFHIPQQTKDLITLAQVDYLNKKTKTDIEAYENEVDSKAILEKNIKNYSECKITKNGLRKSAQVEYFSQMVLLLPYIAELSESEYSKEELINVLLEKEPRMNRAEIENVLIQLPVLHVKNKGEHKIHLSQSLKAAADELNQELVKEEITIKAHILSNSLL